MTNLTQMTDVIESELHNHIISWAIALNELTVECSASQVKALLTTMKDHPLLSFDELVDLCAVDYLMYGEYDWETDSASESGFSRGVERQQSKAYALSKPRFAVVYHLLSTSLNQRIRIKVFIDEKKPIVPSVAEIWKGANWFEREAYDLYGILFDGHPDLRRILTDYGFIGHPFRKDFPLSGHVEMRYDANLQKVIYEPVDIEPRIGVPKVIRSDNRYLGNQGANE